MASSPVRICKTGSVSLCAWSCEKEWRRTRPVFTGMALQRSENSEVMVFYTEAPTPGYLHLLHPVDRMIPSENKPSNITSSHVNRSSRIDKMPHRPGWILNLWVNVNSDRKALVSFLFLQAKVVSVRQDCRILWKIISSSFSVVRPRTCAVAQRLVSQWNHHTNWRAAQPRVPMAWRPGCPRHQRNGEVELPRVRHFERLEKATVRTELIACESPNMAPWRFSTSLFQAMISIHQ